MRVFNFSAGPAVLPEVGAAAGRRRDARLARQRHVGDGNEPSRQGVHRASPTRPKPTCARCSRFPPNYKVLFLQGGAIGENAIVPMNLVARPRPRRLRQHRRVVEEVDQGSEEVLHGQRRRHRRRTQGFTYVPPQSTWKLDAAAPRTCTSAPTRRSAASISLDARHRRRAARRRHVVAHPVARDRRRRSTASSTAARRRTSGPAGLTLVIVRDDLLDRALPITPSAFHWKEQAAARLDAQHAADLLDLHRRAGVRMAARAGRRRRRSSGRTSPRRSSLYDYLDAVGVLPQPRAQGGPLADERAVQAADDALDEAFLKGAKAHGMVQLKGHRAVGGMRASIYNAMPIEGVRGARRLHAGVRAQRG